MSVTVNTTKYTKDGIVVNYSDASEQQTLVFGGDHSLTVTNASTVFIGTVNVEGASTLQNDLTVGGNSQFDGTVAAGGSMLAGASLNVVGPTNLQDVLTVESDSVLVGNLSVGMDVAISGNSVLTGDLSVFGATNLENTLSVSGDTALGAALSVTGDANLLSTLEVSGAAILADSLSVTGAVTMASTLDVSSATTLKDVLNVSGASTLASTLDVTGLTTLSAAMSVVGDVSVGGVLSVTGLTTLNDSLSVLQDTTLLGFLGVTKAAQLSDTLTVTSLATFMDSLSVSMDVSVGGVLSVTGNSMLSGDLSVMGATNLQDVLNVQGASNLFSSLAVTGATQLSDTLAVTNSTTLSDILSVGGATTLGDVLSVVGDTSIGGILSVTMATNLGDVLSVSGATSIGGTLDVAGASALADVLSVSGATVLLSTLDVSGATALADALSVTGAAVLLSTLDVSGATALADTLNVTGISTLSSDVNIGGNTAIALMLQVTGSTTLQDTLDVSLATTLHDILSVTGAASLSSTLDVVGATNLGNILSVTGDANLSSTLEVGGVATLADALSVAGDANLASTLEVALAATLSSTLSVGGNTMLSADLSVPLGLSTLNELIVTHNASVSGDLTVAGSLTVQGTLTTLNTQNLVVEDNVIVCGNLNPADALDLGISFQYKKGSVVNYAGLKRFPTDPNGLNGGDFVLFKDAAVEEGTAAIEQLAGEYIDLDAAQSTVGVIQLVDYQQSTIEPVPGLTKPLANADPYYASVFNQVPNANLACGDAGVYLDASNNMYAVYPNGSMYTVDSDGLKTPIVAQPVTSSWTKILYYSGVGDYFGDSDDSGNAGAAPFGVPDAQVTDNAPVTTSIAYNYQPEISAMSGEYITVKTSIPAGAHAVASYSGVSTNGLSSNASWSLVGCTDAVISGSSAWLEVDSQVNANFNGTFVCAGKYAATPFNFYRIIFERTQANFTVGHNLNFQMTLFQDAAGTSVQKTMALNVADPNVMSAGFSGGNLAFWAMNAGSVGSVPLNAGTYVAGVYGGSASTDVQVDITQIAIETPTTFAAELSVLARMATVLAYNNNAPFGCIENADYENTGNINVVSTLNAQSLLSNYLAMTGPTPNVIQDGARLHKSTSFFGDAAKFFCVHIPTKLPDMNQLMPNQVTYLGSKDNGVTWNVIHSKAAGNGSETSSVLVPSGPGASYQYTKYRIVVQSLNAANTLAYGTWNFIDAVQGTNIPLTVSGTSAGFADITFAFNSMPFGQYDSIPAIMAAAVSADVSAVFDASGAYTGAESVGATVAALPSYATLIADSFTCASDRNLKKNIVTIEHALDSLDAIRGVYHDWIDEKNTENAIGVIAQEVQAVYPALVHQGSDGFLSVNYPKLTAVLLQSIKELKAMVLAIAAKQQ